MPSAVTDVREPAYRAPKTLKMVRDPMACWSRKSPGCGVSDPDRR
ncbi:hypothetical protein ACNKHU_25750 [Shigella flexneri]